MKLWSGRFSKDVDSRVNDFNSSISFDKRLYRQDIEGSMAHAEMLCKCGIISPEDNRAIQDGLKGILEDVEAGKLDFSADAEDIHMNIETVLTERIGDAGKRLHTARSRNDQVAVDIRLYMRNEIDAVSGELNALIKTVTDIAEKTTDYVMPSYTHLQRAQPVSFAHYIMAYAQMFLRDRLRFADCRKRLNFCPLGAGALATTTYPIDRNMTAELLGFDGICENSIDAVSDRDFLIEFCSDCAMTMMHLSRFCEEIILWCSSEFGFITLDDAFSTGSSIMPQKKNPDVAELCRGKTGRVYGSLTALLTVMKSLPLAYNKDMQEDKEAVFDCADTVKMCLHVFTPMLATATVNRDKLRAAASKGFINATDCADYLAKKGLPFRDAYKTVGKAVMYCEKTGKDFESLTMDEYKELSPLFENDIYEAINLENCMLNRKAAGGPSPESVKIQIENLKKANETI
ncbi:MAG: argininosuccinate lyase [Clostridia bacterium]|nr:argininosuccinate lyase [Clostridia bacterium]